MSETIEFTVRVIVTEEETPMDQGGKYLVLSIETNPINGTEGPKLEGGLSIRFKDLQKLSDAADMASNAADMTDDKFSTAWFIAMSSLDKEMGQLLGDGLWKYIRVAEGIQGLPKKAFENWFSRYEGSMINKSILPPAPGHPSD